MRASPKGKSPLALSPYLVMRRLALILVALKIWQTRLHPLRPPLFQVSRPHRPTRLIIHSSTTLSLRLPIPPPHPLLWASHHPPISIQPRQHQTTVILISTSFDGCQRHRSTRAIRRLLHLALMLAVRPLQHFKFHLPWLLLFRYIRPLRNCTRHQAVNIRKAEEDQALPAPHPDPAPTNSWHHFHLSLRAARPYHHPLDREFYDTKLLLPVSLA